MSKRRAIHERVLNATDVDELSAAYAQWAETYDADLVDEMGYKAHRQVASALREALDPEGSRLLDAGCGTGLVGLELARLGYQSIDGLDYSRDMLAQAASKKVYQAIMQGNLMASLDIATDCYDAVTCVGTFTLGHVGPSAFRELIRVVRPGGYVCFSVRDEAWQEDDYESSILSLASEGLWTVLGMHTANYIEEEGSTCRVCLCQV